MSIACKKYIKGKIPTLSCSYPYPPYQIFEVYSSKNLVRWTGFFVYTVSKNLVWNRQKIKKRWFTVIYLQCKCLHFDRFFLQGVCVLLEFLHRGINPLHFTFFILLNSLRHRCIYSVVGFQLAVCTKEIENIPILAWNIATHCSKVKM